MTDKLIVVPHNFPIVVRDSDSMLLPTAVLHCFLWHPYYMPLMEEMRQGQIPFVFMVMQRPNAQSFPRNAEGLYQAGVVCKVIEVDSATPRVGLYGMYRARARYRKNAKNLWVTDSTEPIHDKEEEQFVNQSGDMVVSSEYKNPILGLFLNIKTKLRILCEMCAQFAGADDADTQGLVRLLDNLGNYDLEKRDSIEYLVWQIVYATPVVDPSQKQHFIEATSLMRRLGGCLGLLEQNIAVINSAIQYDFAAKNRKNRQRGKVKAGGPAGGDLDSDSLANVQPEIAERWKKYQEIKDSLTPDQDKAILEDFGRLNSSNSESTEHGMFMNHLDTLLALFSSVPTSQETDISKVKEKLGKSHCGLEDVKDRIYNYLATKIRNPKGKAPILCFVGPPGTGKTSIGKSIADSLGLKFIRLSLGGVRDEAEIRGHRRTYIGAMPGKIVKKIIESGASNSVFMLDEVDKINNDFRGDPSSALLEVLDPEQNHSFQDHYVEAPLDLSGVLFLCTANLKSGIQPALLDRMDVISISGYTENEKVQIAKEFLVPKQIVEEGLSDVKLGWQDDNPDAVLSKIIRGYTREAGVRQLERQIRQIFSWWGRRSMENEQGELTKQLVVTEKLVEEFLGTSKYTRDRVKPTVVGEMVGLAWTPFGGDILYIQARIVPFTGKELSLTGKQGKVMQEACKVAMSVARSLAEKKKIHDKVLGNKTVHIHIPDAAVDKDGPSAGAATFCALYSAIFNVKARRYVSMTGEITLMGLVTRVGGVKEKVLAAHRDGIKEVILPVKNRENVKKDIPDEIKRELKFHFVTRIEEVLPIVFPDDASNA